MFRFLEQIALYIIHSIIQLFKKHNYLDKYTLPSPGHLSPFGWFLVGFVHDAIVGSMLWIWLRQRFVSALFWCQKKTSSERIAAYFFQPKCRGNAVEFLFCWFFAKKDSENLINQSGWCWSWREMIFRRKFDFCRRLKTMIIAFGFWNL